MTSRPPPALLVRHLSFARRPPGGTAPGEPKGRGAAWTEERSVSEPPGRGAAWTEERAREPKGRGGAWTEERGTRKATARTAQGGKRKNRARGTGDGGGRRARRPGGEPEKHSEFGGKHVNEDQAPDPSQDHGQPSIPPETVVAAGPPDRGRGVGCGGPRLPYGRRGPRRALRGLHVPRPW